jgi:hypothetical protein
MPLLRHMPIAAPELAWMDRGNDIPRSAAKAWAPRPSATPFTTPPSSASSDDRVTYFWVTDQCLRTWEPRKRMPPEVDLRVCEHPAKSVST